MSVEKMFKVGVKVVRGKDWKWGDQDGGEGHTGTVVKLGDEDSKTVTVCWDKGTRENCYRVGSENCFDLGVFDPAPVGVKHPNANCDGCNEVGINKFRWKCLNCSDFDFCTNCYMNKASHEKSHVFGRLDVAQVSKKIDLSPRDECRKVSAKGIFTDARVVRSLYWQYGDEDGGDEVQWDSGKVQSYRIGYQGKIDLKCVKPSSGGDYYVEHLPPLVFEKLENEFSPIEDLSVSDLMSLVLMKEIVWRKHSNETEKIKKQLQLQ